VTHRYDSGHELLVVMEYMATNMEAGSLTSRRQG